jgi:hypothetical protein
VAEDLVATASTSEAPLALAPEAPRRRTPQPARKPKRKPAHVVDPAVETKQEESAIAAETTQDSAPSELRSNVRFGLAVLRNANSDTDAVRTQGGFFVGAEFLQRKTWGLKVLTRASVKEFSGENKLPFWTAWHGQWHLDEGLAFGPTLLRPTLNLGFEGYFNRGSAGEVQAVRQYLGPSLGLTLRFLMGASRRYEMGGDVLYTWFDNGYKLFVSGNAYYNLEASPWSLGAGYWVDALKMGPQFRETFTSLEANIRYKY